MSSVFLLAVMSTFDTLLTYFMFIFLDSCFCYFKELFLVWLRGQIKISFRLNIKYTLKHFRDPLYNR